MEPVVQNLESESGQNETQTVNSESAKVLLMEKEISGYDLLDLENMHEKNINEINACIEKIDELSIECRSLLNVIQDLEKDNGEFLKEIVRQQQMPIKADENANIDNRSLVCSNRNLEDVSTLVDMNKIGKNLEAEVEEEKIDWYDLAVEKVPFRVLELKGWQREKERVTTKRFTNEPELVISCRIRNDFDSNSKSNASK